MRARTGDCLLRELIAPSRRKNTSRQKKMPEHRIARSSGAEAGIEKKQNDFPYFRETKEIYSGIL